MKTKAKKFSHKLLALFMAVLMAASCFTGALTAYADTMSSEKTYADDSIEYNDLAWAILSDEQVATALLDYADLMLAEYGPQIDKLLENLPSSITQYITWDSNSRTLKLNAFGLVKKDIPVRTHSVDEIFFTLRGVADLLNQYGNLLGDAGNLNFKAVATKDWSISRETANVREKMSLCYYCSARYTRLKSCILVQCGCLEENMDKAVNEILHQLDVIKSGDYEEEFNSSRMALVDAVGAVCDMPETIESWYIQQICDERYKTPQEVCDDINNVKYGEIKECANLVSLDTVYKLVGQEEE